MPQSLKASTKMKRSEIAPKPPGRRRMKKTPIGEIPVDWGVVPLGNIAEFANGLNFLASDAGHITRIVGVGDFLQRLTVRPESLRTVTTSRTLRPSELLKENDLLFVRSNGNKDLIGRCVLIPELHEPVSFSGFTIRSRLAPDSALPSFVNYYVRTVAARRQMARLGGGTNISNLNQSILRSLQIPLPPLAEQKKIAEILSTWDRAIEKTEKLIQAKQKLKKALMQQLLTGKTRFREFKRQEWKEYRLGELFDERVEQKCNDLRLLSITAGRGVIPRDEVERKDTSNVDKSKYLRICPGDIGYNTMRMWQGVSAVSDLEGIVSPAYTICIPGESIDELFAGYLFKYPPVIHLFWRYSQGLVADTLNLKFHNFSQIRVNIPDVAEQREIASVLRKCDHEIGGLVDCVEEIQDQKKGLMQKLLTGKIRVGISGRYNCPDERSSE